MNKPKIIFIDWNGTLSNSKFWGHLESSSKEDLKKFIKIEKSLFGNYLGLIKPWMKGESTSENIIDLVSKDTNIDKNYIKEHFVQSCKEMVFVSDTIPKLINKIRQNSIKVYIATNNMDSFDRWTVPAMRLNDIFDGIINSYDLKAVKDDLSSSGKSLFFDYVFKTEKIKPSEAVMIDDSEDKRNIISSLGIKYIRINQNFTIENALIDILDNS